MTARVANTLAEAGPRDLVHVDSRGRVRTRARTRVVAIAYWGLLGALIGLEGWLGYELLGAPGLSIAVALGGYVGWIFSRVTQLRRAMRHLVQSEFDAAEAAFERVTTSRLTPAHLRARAMGGLASVARLRGDDALALERIRRALAMYPARRRRRPLVLTSRHMEVHCLIRLGRLEEARAAWNAMATEVPEGEFVRLSHYTTELYLAFAEGRHALDDDALHERASFALEITVAAPLLALLGWAFEQNGDREMAELLTQEARDRHPGELMSVPMPDLDAWLSGRGERPRVRVARDVAEAKAEIDGSAHVARARRA